MAKYPLNEDQLAAAEWVFGKLMGPDKEFGIIGPGGVGKTVLVSHLIDEVIPQYEQACGLLGIECKYESVAILSTTNQAAAVLSAECGRPTQTAASFFNLKVTENFKTGAQTLEKTGNWCVHENMIIFIDEASMIDSQMRKYIQEGTCNCKIIYVGDDCQMTPVMEKLSPVYDPVNSIEHYELTKIMRCDHPALLALNTQMREQVKTGKVAEAIKIVPGVIDWFSEDQIYEALETNFKETKLPERFLVFTNKRVIQFNDFIRDVRGLGHQYVVGEQLVCQHPYQASKHYNISVSEEVEIVDIDPKVNVEHVYHTDDGDIEIAYNLVTLRSRVGVDLPLIRLPNNRDHFAGVLQWLKDSKLWKPYYDLKKRFIDLRQRDASTTHKAQGSSENVVYIDLTDISKCKNPADALRLLYVAMSRARERIVLFGELKEKYGVLQF